MQAKPAPSIPGLRVSSFWATTGGDRPNLLFSPGQEHAPSVVGLSKRAPPTPFRSCVRRGVGLFGLMDSEPILQFFVYAHLPEKLQALSKPFADLAYDMVTKLPRNPERTVMLRKLLESKDCAVRASLYSST